MNFMDELRTLVADHREFNLELNRKFFLLAMFSNTRRYYEGCREIKTSIISQSIRPCIPLYQPPGKRYQLVVPVTC